MTRDYKRKRKPAKKTADNSAWKFLFAGFGMGLVAALVLYLNLRPDTDSGFARSSTPVPDVRSTPQSVTDTEAPPQPVKVAAAPAKKPSPLPAPGKEDYQFYELLPEFEVVLSDADNQSNSSVSQPAPQKVQPATVAGPPSTYFLQAGSFKSFTDADRRKAELAFKGIESNIQQVVLDKDQTWFRVYVGPSDNLPKLENIRSTLRSANIDVLMLKVKP